MTPPDAPRIIRDMNAAKRPKQKQAPTMLMQTRVPPDVGEEVERRANEVSLSVAAWLRLQLIQMFKTRRK